MQSKIMYIELKSGYSDNGPAWIGRVNFSKSGQTIYFNNKAFKKWNGVSGNYYEVETEDEYWISGVKKDGNDRHWAGNGKIMIDKKAIDEYLMIIDKESLDMKKFQVVEIVDEFPVERVNQIENEKSI